MTLRDDIKPYLDPAGLVTVNPYKSLEDSTGNGVLYLSEYIVLLHLRKELTQSDKADFLLTMQKCMPVHQGLLHRSPTHIDQNGPDDYAGYLTACYLTQNHELASSTIRYAKAHWGFLNNEVPGTYRKRDGRFNWSAFLVRQPQLIALAYWAAGKRAPLWTALWTAVTLALAGWRKPVEDTDSHILAWMLGQVAIKESKLCAMAYRVFDNRLRKDYAKGMQEVFKIYFNGLAHPIALYMR